MLLNSSTAYTVLLPTAPTARESFAGEELSRYLTRILGKAPVAADKADVRFIVGGPSRNPAAAALIGKAEFDALVTGDEGYLIRIAGDAVLLAGSEGKQDDERGTLYAVYDFLEKYCGCAFAAFSHPDVDAGEIVPANTEASLQDGDLVKPAADCPCRCAIVQYGDRAGNAHRKLNPPFFDWLAKNRYNRVYIWASSYVAFCEDGLIAELEKRGIRLTVGHHESLWLWLPYYGNPYFSEHYIETHPEFFRLNADGTRFMPKEPNDPFGQWILCSRNEECIETVSRNMIEFISKNPVVDTVTLMMNDGRAEQCCCPRCAPYTKGENYIHFVNEVVSRVAAVHPNAKVEFGVYVDIWKCPEGIKLHPNVGIMEATWASCGLRTGGKADGTSYIGTDFDETAVSWRKTGASLYIYDYYMGVFANRQRVIPMADEQQAIWRRYKETDLAGAGTQIETFNVWNHLLNFYSFARTGYDTSLSLEDNIASIGRLFGDGAPAIGEIMRYLEATYDGQADVAHGGIYLMQNIDRDKVYALFDTALAAAKTARERNNIRLLRMAFRHSDLDVFDKTTEVWDWKGAHREYDDPTGELAYIATNYDSFARNDPGYGISCPGLNTDIKGFVPNEWYAFE